jgi:hypothetical protein
VDHDWYDDPRQGLAAIECVGHYFLTVSYFYSSDGLDGMFLVWPAGTVA